MCSSGLECVVPGGDRDKWQLAPLKKERLGVSGGSLLGFRDVGWELRKETTGK